MSRKAIKSQEESSKLAAEAVSNHRTITAFSSQDRILKTEYQIAGIAARFLRYSPLWRYFAVLPIAMSVNPVTTPIAVVEDADTAK